MEASRCQLVDSLYGPGTVGAWLLTLCAVLTSWTINKHSRAKDNVSMDLIAAVLLPLVATGHLIFLIIQLPLSIGEVIVSTNPGIQQYAAAMEAPLTICETFAIMSLPFTMACAAAWRRNANPKRYVAIFVTGELCWIVEDIFFVMVTMKGIQADQITLDRPYLFMVTFIITGAWGFLFSFTVISAALSLVLILNQNSSRHGDDVEKPYSGHPSKQQTKTPRQLQPEDRVSSASVETANKQFELGISHFEKIYRNRNVYSQTIESWNISSLYLAPLALAASVLGLGLTTMPKSVPYGMKFYLIPRSNSSLRDLDQIVALVGGVLVLLASLRDAYRSRAAKNPMHFHGRRRSV